MTRAVDAGVVADRACPTPAAHAPAIDTAPMPGALDDPVPSAVRNLALLAPAHGDADEVLLHDDQALLRPALLLSLPRLSPLASCIPRRMRGGKRVPATAASLPASLYTMLLPTTPLLPFRLCGAVRVFEDNLFHLRQRRRV